MLLLPRVDRVHRCLDVVVSEHVEQRDEVIARADHARRSEIDIGGDLVGCNRLIRLEHLGCREGEGFFERKELLGDNQHIDLLFIGLSRNTQSELHYRDRNSQAPPGTAAA